MRKVLTFVFIFSGTIFAVFILNIVMYALVPVYHDTIESALGRDEIPVVTGSTVESTVGSTVIESEPVATVSNPVDELVKETDNVFVFTSGGSDYVENDCEPIIIDREYHEDCGTGKGYWVLTYADGTVVIE